MAGVCGPGTVGESAPSSGNERKRKRKNTNDRSNGIANSRNVKNGAVAAATGGTIVGANNSCPVMQDYPIVSVSLRLTPLMEMLR